MSTSNFSHGYESNAATQAYNIQTPVTYSNNISNSISDQQPMLNNNVTDHVSSPNHNHQQQYQYIQQHGIPNNNVTIDHNMPNVVSNNNVTTSCDTNHHTPNNIPNQHSTSNNGSSPQFYYNQNQPNPPQSNILPLHNPFGINIHSQATIIIISPISNLDVQNQLQQIFACLNHSPSARTRF